MMGTSHALTGAAAWVAVTATTVPALEAHPLPPGSVILGSVVCAGAALLPDADHHNATIAHSVPGAGRVVAGAIGTVTGGHRKGTHSILAVLGVIAGTIGLSLLNWTPPGWDHGIQVGSAIATAATVTFALKALKLVRQWPQAWLVGIVLASAVAFFAPGEWSWLPLCIGLGYLVHILGDFLTSGGVPWLWPLMPKPPQAARGVPLLESCWRPHGAFALPILGNTGSIREWMLTIPATAYWVWGVAGSALLLVGRDPGWV